MEAAAQRQPPRTARLVSTLLVLQPATATTPVCGVLLALVLARLRMGTLGTHSHTPRRRRSRLLTTLEAAAAALIRLEPALAGLRQRRDQLACHTTIPLAIPATVTVTVGPAVHPQPAAASAVAPPALRGCTPLGGPSLVALAPQHQTQALASGQAWARAVEAAVQLQLTLRCSVRAVAARLVVRVVAVTVVAEAAGLLFHRLPHPPRHQVFLAAAPLRLRLPALVPRMLRCMVAVTLHLVHRRRRLRRARPSVQQALSRPLLAAAAAQVQPRVREGQARVRQLQPAASPSCSPLPPPQLVRLAAVLPVEAAVHLALLLAAFVCDVLLPPPLLSGVPAEAAGCAVSCNVSCCMSRG